MHGAESKHSYGECRHNPKNANTTNKSSYYVKKRGHDAHYNDNRRRSSGEESPSKHDTPIPSDGEVDDKSSDDERSNSNYNIDDTPKMRRLVKKNNVGHKSPTQKKRKTLVEPDSGMEKTPKKNRPSKSDGNLLNLYDTDDVTSDDAKSCLSITNDNGLSFANLDEDDAYGFDN